MEKLIKIQRIINQIEDLQGLKEEYRSTFEYVDECELEIRTFCTDQAIGYYKTLERGIGFSVYINNAKIKIIEHGSL